MRRHTPFYGHSISWSHYETPRTCPGFYAERPSADRWVFRVCGLILVGLVLALAAGCV